MYIPQTLQNLCCECKGQRRVSCHCTSRSCLPLPQSHLGNVCSKCVCSQRFLSSQQSKACLRDHKVCIALHVADGAVAIPHFNVSRRRVHFKGHCIAMAMALAGFKDGECDTTPYIISSTYDSRVCFGSCYYLVSDKGRAITIL